MKSQKHSERAHSKFSASGAERWFNCPGSVALSEGLPDRTSKYAEEGTRAHEVLEVCLTNGIKTGMIYSETSGEGEMYTLARDAAKFILQIAQDEDDEILVEQKVYLDFIHPEAFGTFDAGVIDHFGTLHVFDYKYGAGHPVSVRENLQMLFYAIGLAHRYKWNFKRVRMWIIQPRIRGYDGPEFWEIAIMRLKGWTHLFEKAVKRVERLPEYFVEGEWCWWCKARGICPLKKKAKLEEAKFIFRN